MADTPRSPPKEAKLKHSLENREGTNTDEGRGDLAAYMADLISELEALAAREKMTTLCYFLNLARVEAESMVAKSAAKSSDPL